MCLLMVQVIARRTQMFAPYRIFATGSQHTAALVFYADAPRAPASPAPPGLPIRLIRHLHTCSLFCRTRFPDRPMAELSYFTREGLDKLKAELHDMKTRQRSEAAAAIAEAREKGDLSENAEYDAAKEAQGLLELKISKMETLVANARILDTTNLDTSKVYIMCKVRIRNTTVKREVTYTLVSPKESDLSAGLLSVESPIAKAMLGKAVGDKFTFQAPAGGQEFEILEISR